MVELASHRQRMNDRSLQEHKIGAEFAGLRSAHLTELDALEEEVRAAAPLPISYDVTRLHPPYFMEFTYTELLGGIYVAPQSSEIAARVMTAALEVEPGHDPVPAILARKQMDKYQLEAGDGAHKRVAFLAGSNIFERAVCKEALSRAMQDDPDLVIKPHPMTNEDALRKIGRLYGYHRVLEPKSSGWACLLAAEEVLTLSTSEMGLYAVLLGKPITNLTRISYEPRAAYSPIYRLLWGQSPDEAKERLSRLLASPCSGFIHPSDPTAPAKARAVMDLAMRLREPFRPLLQDFDMPDYAAFLLHGARTPQGT